ncbi:MAG: hypothetical protein QOJ35_3181 [Solirubrobacteraceae bacterium]|jgi:hypothetical protein|nr:hypothetical protein [Solirubrobacteraceae bacterium]
MPRALVLVVSLAAVLPAAPAAQAATLSTDANCYQETQDVVISGAGYAPTSVIAISRDGAPFGTANSDAAGNFQAKFAADELPRDEREQVFTLTAVDAAVTTASTRYRTSKIFADFNPDSGDPKTLQVRFEVNGFALMRSHASVYLHYVSPGGTSRRDVRLGTARGTCGKITKTRLRHLFPFPAERGRWILQFDTNSRYTRATSKSPYIWVRKPVEIYTR